MSNDQYARRDFLLLGVGLIGAASSSRVDAALAAPSNRCLTELKDSSHGSGKLYTDANLANIAFPMGGIGAGMFCLEGTGALSKFSLRHRPDLDTQPRVFAAVSIQNPGRIARLLEGPVPAHKLNPSFRGSYGPDASLTWGLPRFRNVAFQSRFPFAMLDLTDESVPLAVKLTGWSPFTPGDADNSSLPVAGLEYEFINQTSSTIDAVFSFNAENIMAVPRKPFEPSPNPGNIHTTTGGFILHGVGARDDLLDEGYCAIWVDDVASQVDHAWFNSGLGLYFDSIRMLWNDIESGQCRLRPPSTASAPGASIFVPFKLDAGATRTITVFLAWYVPNSPLSFAGVTVEDGKFKPSQHVGGTHQPWYAARFKSIQELQEYWRSNYSALRETSETFARTFYDSTIPHEVLDAVAANLAILKSPTVLRQTDGRLWAWEGSGSDSGAGGPGSCTHVWNYAQALPHLFPSLERTLRETEFYENQSSDGLQAHRGTLPIRPIGDTKEGRALSAAADGQLGGIIKLYREWRISGNTTWLRRLWPRARSSLDYCIRTWDPEHRGWVEEGHVNTYDVRFWGPDSMCTSIYLGALKAAALMGAALADDVTLYSKLLRNGIRRMQDDLYNGEYFIQRIEWKALRTPFSPRNDVEVNWFPISPEGVELTTSEGPPYQYGSGCLSDGVLGAWLCMVSGIDDVLDGRKVESHLDAVYRYNYTKGAKEYPRVGRSHLATATESGLLVCTWPRGERPSLPVIYADEVFTGIEYQVASHLISRGRIEEGLEIVRTARARYDGQTRNPFAEAETGQWYARAMSSYALLQALSGARYDAVERVLYLRPRIKGDFRCFLSTATGYGIVGIKDGAPFLQVSSGTIPCRGIEYTHDR